MVIVKNNIKRMSKSKINWVFFLVLPVILMYMLVQVQLSSNTYNIAVVDYDKTDFTEKIKDRVSEVGNILDDTKQEDIKDGLLNSEYDYAVVIPKGLTEKVEAGEDVQVKGYGIMESNVSEPVKYMLRSYLSASQLIGGNIADKNDFIKAMDDYEGGKVVCKVKDISDKEAAVKSNFITSLGIAVMCMMLLLTFSTTLIIKDKASGFYDRVMTAPISKASYQAQHILSYFLVALVQIGILLYLAMMLSHMESGAYLGKVIVLFVLFALAAVSLGILVSSFTKNTRQANGIISLLTIPSCMLGGCLWNREMMPDVMQKIGNFVPTTWVMKGIDAAVSNVESYVNCLMILVVFIVVFFLGGIIKTQR